MAYRFRFRDILASLILVPAMAVWTKANLEGINILDNPLNAAMLPLVGIVVFFYFRGTQSKSEPVPA
jgi:hypothetical protein